MGYQLLNYQGPGEAPPNVHAYGFAPKSKPPAPRAPPSFAPKVASGPSGKSNDVSICYGYVFDMAEAAAVKDGIKAKLGVASEFPPGQNG